MNPKPLPCPFCGQQPKFTRITDHGPELLAPFWSLGCPGKPYECHSMPAVSGDTKSEAIADWNVRRIGDRQYSPKYHPITLADAVPFTAVCGNMIVHVTSLEGGKAQGGEFITMTGILSEGIDAELRYKPGDPITYGPISNFWRRISFS